MCGSSNGFAPLNSHRQIHPKNSVSVKFGKSRRKEMRSIEETHLNIGRCKIPVSLKDDDDGDKRRKGMENRRVQRRNVDVETSRLDLKDQEQQQDHVRSCYIQIIQTPSQFQRLERFITQRLGSFVHLQLWGPGTYNPKNNKVSFSSFLEPRFSHPIKIINQCIILLNRYDKTTSTEMSLQSRI